MTFIIGIVLASLVATSLGVLWYSPFFLGRPWSRLAQVEDRPSSPLSLILPFVAWLAAAYVVTLILASMGAYSGWQGVEGAFWAWLGLTLPFGFLQVFYERRPFALLLIDQAYYLLALVLMGAMLATW